MQLKFKLPQMKPREIRQNFKHSRFGLTTSQIPLNFYFLIELIVLGLLPVVIIAGDFPAELLRSWLLGAAIIFIARVGLTLFYGFKLWPPVKFDLSLLTAITLILLATIGQTDATTLTSLGAGNFWGVGTVILAGISLYFWASFLAIRSNQRLLLNFQALTITFAAVVSLVNQLISSRVTTTTIGTGLLMLVILELALVTAKQQWLRGLFRLGELAIILGIFVAGGISELAGIAIALTVTGVVGLAISPQRKFGAKFAQLRADLEKLTQGKSNYQQLAAENPVIVTLILGLMATAATFLTVVTNPIAASELEGVSREFSGYVISLTSSDSFNVDRLIFGSVNSGSGISSIALLRNYGFVGLVGVAFFLNSIRRNLATLEKSYTNILKILAVLVSLGLIITTEVGVELQFLITLILGFSLGQQLFENKDKLNLPLIHTTRLTRLEFKRLGEVGADIVTTTRLLLALTLLVYTPQILSFLKEIYLG